MTDRLAAHAVTGYHLCSRCIPYSAWLGIGRALGNFLYLVAGKHRRIAEANIRFAFGKEIAEDEIPRIIRRNFQHFGMVGQEFIKLRQPSEMTAEYIDRVVHVEGEEHLLAAKEKSKSVILLGAHFGNWELGHLYYARHYNRLNFIVRRIDNPLLEKTRYRYNTDLGVNIIYKNRGLKEAIKHLSQGEDLVILADQNANRREGISCNFFGHPTTSLYIAPSLAQKYRVPLVPMFTVREKDRQHHRLVFLPEIPIEYGEMKEDVQTLAAMQNERIEQIITLYPDQWLWFHRKWKVDYPEIYR
jgi:Kdo2-lipid IVA lauroyltransferase/acyltransferase